MSRNGIWITTVTKPPFKEAMGRARMLATKKYDPPLTRSELFYIYRSCINGENVFLRCAFG